MSAINDMRDRLSLINFILTLHLTSRKKDLSRPMLSESMNPRDPISIG